ncbi:Nif11-like leader peptide family RiPP precursor [Aquabacter sp. L1I39]|uniref:Nif11-like leader peptide family RiPP precursor n=1 Tax=Aquabacter sp. L1I39 TaxID=2820278 RepID=UPI001AD9FABE|nr:Nif11-like leader peptide family RiPP precursor [Aquabacter sp. L1I39]QTL02353.1 Nif11-like leader peptide family RiPP precursor [Aquabacter sp. L1I39]
MNEKLAALLAAIETDPDVASRFQDALPEHEPLTPEMFLAAAQAAGFTLSPEDLPQAGLLSEAELEGVSGGGNPFMILERWRSAMRITK